MAKYLMQLKIRLAFSRISPTLISYMIYNYRLLDNNRFISIYKIMNYHFNA